MNNNLLFNFVNILPTYITYFTSFVQLKAQSMLYTLNSIYDTEEILRIIPNIPCCLFSSNPQVSTNTGILSRKIHLRIVTPEAFILGGDEYHIDRGSQISLVCVIENAPTPPQ